MDFARNEQGFCVGFAWNLILFSFVREREGYKHHADCTVHSQIISNVDKSYNSFIIALHEAVRKQREINTYLSPPSCGCFPAVLSVITSP